MESLHRVLGVLHRVLGGATQGTRGATQGTRELLAQCVPSHPHTNRTLDSLTNVDRIQTHAIGIKNTHTGF